MELRELEAFFWVGTLRSFSRAADRLRTSQPTISARVAALEAHLTVKLLERGGRRVRLTPLGAEMLGYAERMLGLRSQAEAAVSGAAGLRGHVRLGTAETVVHTWLPHFIRELETRHPRLSLELTVDTTPNLREELVRGELDLAILLGPISEPTMQSRLISTYPLSLVAAPSLGLAGRELTLADLARYPLITYSHRTRPTIALRELFRNAGLPQPRLIASASLAANIRLAVDGVGPATLPEILVAGEIAEGRLHALTVDFELAPLRFTVTHPRAPSDPLIAAAAELARQVAANYQES
ncbi:LysR family transcriptional regulator [Enterovirga sp. CN4-39]|uniref:LysR family transcriptional regulator n=1 Tax=Enterovirga sp. CN4-39 TaxID=3400910 RepID=UPI003C06E2B2